ncbi:MAG: c-type cytochrome [Gemmatales bacterium]
MKLCLLAFLAFSSVCLSTLGNDDAAEKPMAAQRVAETMQLPEGFRATCFASEPDVVQPIAFTIDTRGRLWVVESMAYPNWLKSGPGKDRVVILEDTDGDGVFDKRTVFLDNGRNLSGIEMGFGGVWLLSAPEMIFIPVKEGEDKPAGPAKVVLDGWDTELRHNIVSNLTWGMDGWLYGCHGILKKSKVGKPGAAAADRKEIDCGVWRYHPTKGVFEVVCWGSTNPWGLDYDQYGTWFMTNCVIDHVFQVVPNAHYIRMFGSDMNPYIYHPLPGCADHKHWGGGKWTEGGRFDDNLGGHAHSGLMIYQDGNWPAEYRNQLYTLSIHGKRLQRDSIDYQGPVAIARHQPDVVKVKDSWFMGVQAKAGPDGGVYIIDWNDTGECHSYVNTQKTTGRIYKVTYGKPAVWKKDLSKFSDAELVALHKEQGKEWHIRQARRLLQERAHAGKKLDVESLRAMVEDVKLSLPNRLRAMWTLHACEASPDYVKYWQVEQPDWIRAWALRLVYDHPEKQSRLIIDVANLISPEVIMTLASTLHRMPKEERIIALENLNVFVTSQKKMFETAQHATNKEWLLTLYWNGCEDLIRPGEPMLASRLELLTHPWHIEWATRKLCALKGLNALWDWAKTFTTIQQKQAMLSGLEKSLMEQSQEYTPLWRALLYTLNKDEPTLVQRTQEVFARLGWQPALQALQNQLSTGQGTVEERVRCLTILTKKPNDELLKAVMLLLKDTSLRSEAIKALARFDSDEVHHLLIKEYATSSSHDKQAILATLTTRPRYARAMLDALDAKLIPSTDVLAPTVVALRQLSAADIKKRVAQRWGSDATPAALKERIARLQNQLVPAVLKEANTKNGRVLFDKHCASCHKLFGEGQSVGPELTGAQRMNLDYLLENTVTPNAIVPQDYRASTFVMNNGRVITGMITMQQGGSLTIQTATEKLVISKADIESQQQTNKSLMPEGLLDQLTINEIRDLIGYLCSPQQVEK